MSRTLLLWWSHKNLGSATSHLISLICIVFRFATELALKSLRLLTGCYNFSSHPILHLSSQSMYRREHSALLHLCQYMFPHVQLPWQPSNHFHLLLRVSEIMPNHQSSVPTLPVFRRALKHHLFLLVYPDSSAKSFYDQTSSMYLTSWYSAYCHRTARKYHAAHLNAFHLSAYD